VVLTPPRLAGADATSPPHPGGDAAAMLRRSGVLV
jgi:hypothetical protein